MELAITIFLCMMAILTPCVLFIAAVSIIVDSREKRPNRKEKAEDYI